MDDKARLTKILNASENISWNLSKDEVETVAEQILSYGIIVPPVPIGLPMHCLSGNKIIKAVVTALRFSKTKDGVKCGLTLIDEDGDKMVCSAADIGQIIFFTEKEAIQVLRTQKTIYDICKQECEK